MRLLVSDFYFRLLVTADFLLDPDKLPQEWHQSLPRLVNAEKQIYEVEIQCYGDPAKFCEGKSWFIAVEPDKSF